MTQCANVVYYPNMHDLHDDEEKMLTVSEVANRLKVDSSTIRRMRQQGYFPGARRKTALPKSPWMIPESDVVQVEKKRAEQ